ncbi:hypothetical protein SAMD00019534_031950 [Acytostelium subglobosum LB1]|uniref:hypothetical protein n=1 Tax=Acytostelium subglobosum LB1 TaxID=1410327 RepID=UPI000644D094|nr:hypothetical protein SAMD00019534_031950 [Acytostelium subglobosum LB1]GAM20020.1 hypothetical protein SAMD00019534_031950 [Acytostelium subglobosum LB1]|eukprot:XP_012756782.1 hypothetical protein SAMD00019534_031950 [Acytostelium subglobosum LB1]
MGAVAINLIGLCDAEKTRIENSNDKWAEDEAKRFTTSRNYVCKQEGDVYTMERKTGDGTNVCVKFNSSEQSQEYTHLLDSLIEDRQTGQYYPFDYHFDVTISRGQSSVITFGCYASSSRNDDDADEYSIVSFNHGTPNTLAQPVNIMMRSNAFQSNIKQLLEQQYGIDKQLTKFMYNHIQMAMRKDQDASFDALKAVLV